jgi:sugar phosphate isomerase/epimerase
MHTALHSISYSGSWGQVVLPLEEIIPHVARLGYTGLMLAGKRPHGSPLDLDAAARSRLRGLLVDHNVRLSCLAGYTNFLADAEHAEIPQREMQILSVRELARLAADLEGTIVRIFTAYEHPAVPYSRAWDLTVAAVKECSRQAADHGVTIALQNHHDLAGHWRTFHQFLAAVDEPNCRAAFDAWAPALHGDDLAEAARALAPHTVFTTVANYVRLPRVRYQPDLVNYTRDTDAVQAVPVAEGFIDFSLFLRTLWSEGYTGPVAYEMCSPLRDGRDRATLDRYATSFLDFLGTIEHTPATPQ